MKRKAPVTCTNCDSHFMGERNEDGQPEIPDAIKCAVEWCEVYLCPAGCRHLSFVCSGCGHRVCNLHPTLRLSGEIFCVTCMPEVLENNPAEAFHLPEVA